MSYSDQKYYPFVPKDRKNWKRKERKAGTVSNAEFTKNEFFQAACQKAGIPATSRQASKFRREMGLAFKSKNKE